MSLRDMFIDIGFNVSDNKLRGADLAADKFKSNIAGARTTTNKFESSIAKSGRELDKFKGKTKGAGDGAKNLGKKLLGAAAAYVGVRSVINTFKDWTTAANAQIEAETKLEAVMKNTKGVTNAQIKSVKSYASELQGLGVIGDEVALAGTQQLATYQLQTKTLKKLMPGMEDLLAQQAGLNATQQDSVNIGNMIGKVMAGQVGALSRAGINFTKAQEKVLKFGTEEERAATLAEVLKMNVGGVNKALRETDSGKIKAMTNALGDMKEELGKKILPLQGKFARWFETKIPSVQKTLSRFLDIGIEKFDTLAGFVDNKAIPAFEDLTGFFKSDLAPRFEEIGELVKEIAVEYMPSLNTSTGDLKDGLGDLVTKGLDLVIGALRWIEEHEVTVKTAIGGLTFAWAIQKGTLLALNGAQLVNNGLAIAGAISSGALSLAIGALYAQEFILAGATKITTGAQWAMNAAMSANPVGLVVLGIAALALGLVALYKKSETARKFMDGLWSGIKSGVGSAIGFAVGLMNDFIGALNKIKIPDWVPVLGGKGINIPKITVRYKSEDVGTRETGEPIGANARGTNNWRGGLTWVGEKGPELVDLPKNTKIFSNTKSMDLIKNAFSGNKETIRQESIVDSSTTNSTKKASRIYIDYSPSFNLYGNDDKTLLNKVEKKAKQVFDQMMKEHFHAIALEVD